MGTRVVKLDLGTWQNGPYTRVPRYSSMHLVDMIFKFLEFDYQEVLGLGDVVKP